MLKLLAFVLTAFLANAQLDPRLTAGRWPANWITHAEHGGMQFAVVHFRHQLELTKVPEELLVHATADNRYRLFVNGKFVVEGPPGDDLRHWRFDTIDLAPYLKTGKNTIAAMVWQGGYYRPMWQHSYRLGFLLQSNTKEFDAINTNGTWKTWHNPAYSAIEFEQVDQRFGYRYYVAGAGERFEAEKHNPNWAASDFNDEDWQRARKQPQGSPQNVEGHLPYVLTPRTVPFLNVSSRRFAPLALPMNLLPGQKKQMMLDLGELSIGHLRMAWEGGAKSKIKLRYAEALTLPDKTKGNRDELEGKTAVGPWDEIVADGRKHEFQSLTPRAARFVEVTIETAGETALEITDLHFDELTYPAAFQGTFQSDQAELNRLFKAGRRTLQLGAQETFVSDLGWERLQYIGDTMIQALAWQSVTRDDRLVRLALEQFDYSRVPEGITQSRYPAHLEQLTPIYALSWIQMVSDFWWYRDDPAFVGKFLPGMEQVFSWYRRQFNAEGLLSALPGLDFTDHSYYKQYQAVMQEKPRQTLTIHNLYYSWTLQRAAKVAESLQRPDLAAFWRAEAARINAAIAKLTWNQEKKLFSDSPAQKLYSQQVQVLAVLSGLVSGAPAQDLLQRAMADTSLVPLELYYRFYLGRAMKQAGLADRYTSLLDPWRRMLALGMSTFGETDVEPRSECHPWSTSPNFELMASVAGIEPASAGFKTVEIAPALGDLNSIDVTYPHPRGLIRLQWDKNGKGFVDLPAGLTGTLKWKGQVTALVPGIRRF